MNANVVCQSLPTFAKLKDGRQVEILERRVTSPDKFDRSEGLVAPIGSHQGAAEFLVRFQHGGEQWLSGLTFDGAPELAV